MNNLKVFNTVLLLINTVCLIVIAVTFVLWPKNSVATTPDTQEGAAGNADYIQMKTPYCTLNYPAKWKDMVKYTEKEENGVYTGTFHCLIKDQEIAMFDVYFGAPETGTLIGHILKDGKSVAFNVKSSDFTPDDSWTEDERTIYFGMVNAINTVIESVTNNANYIG